jgi:hypothetical protein
MQPSNRTLTIRQYCAHSTKWPTLLPYVGVLFTTLTHWAMPGHQWKQTPQRVGEPLQHHKAKEEQRCQPRKFLAPQRHEKDNAPQPKTLLQVEFATWSHAIRTVNFLIIDHLLERELKTRSKVVHFTTSWSSACAILKLYVLKFFKWPTNTSCFVLF